jgi:acyl-CoA thioester hydrolase/1,4-dihydroxy-2-naphthoyl-CoA hydrolase
MNSAYRYHCFVPFHLADPAGVLFFGNAFTLVHQAFEHFVLHQLTCPWNSWFQNPEWIVPIRHAEAQYLQPIHAGQECQIELTMSSLSHSSFTLASTIHQHGICCVIKTVHVFCNRKTKQKMAIPSSLLSSLQICLNH